MKSKLRTSKNLIKKILMELEENRSFDEQIPLLLEKLQDNKLSDNKKDDIVSEAQFVLSTLRNRLLITKEEQIKLRTKVVCFLGLSVGSHAVNSWMIESRAQSIKISDPDEISPTNLNRLNASWEQVGENKTAVTSEKVLSINPFCRIYSYETSQINEIEKIIGDIPKTDLIVEQIDNLEGKLEARKVAKRLKIPLIMATDVGDNVFLDVERYDDDQNLEFFNGRVKGMEKYDFAKLDRNTLVDLAIKIVGTEHNSDRMIQSLRSIGSKIKTWPQLGTTAHMAGAMIAKVTRKILLGEAIKSDRYYINFDELIGK